MAAQEVTLGQFAGWLGSLGSQIERMDFPKPLQSCAFAASASIKENFAGSHDPDGKPWAALQRPRPMGGDKPLRNFGILMASATAQGAQGHVRQISARALVFGSNLPQAALHQHGGTVTPKSAGALTIPLTKEAVRSGGARNMPDLFVWRPGRFATAGSKAGPAYLAERVQTGRGRNKKSALKLHWLLVQSVTIPARPFIGINAKLAETWDGILVDFVRKNLGEGPIHG